MGALSIQQMRDYLSRSISSFNENKLNGLLAEVDFRSHLHALGFGGHVSPGGWIARRTGPGQFGHDTVVLFPEILRTGDNYPVERGLPQPPDGLHTICSTFNQLGIKAFYCMPTVSVDGDSSSVRWYAKQLGVPVGRDATPLDECMAPFFRPRMRAYNFLRYHADVGRIPEDSVSEEFSKENLRVGFASRYMAEISDVDGILWGDRFTYPLEIKEKTPASDNVVGDYFGLDGGPFVKLAFYAAKQGNLHSLFIVRQIDSQEERNLVGWWFITFHQLAQYASWVIQGGGPNMAGGRSTVIKIPKAEFTPLNAQTLRTL